MPTKSRFEFFTLPLLLGKIGIEVVVGAVVGCRFPSMWQIHLWQLVSTITFMQQSPASNPHKNKLFTSSQIPSLIHSITQVLVVVVKGSVVVEVDVVGLVAVVVAVVVVAITMPMTTSIIMNMVNVAVILSNLHFCLSVDFVDILSCWLNGLKATNFHSIHQCESLGCGWKGNLNEKSVVANWTV